MRADNTKDWLIIIFQEFLMALFAPFERFKFSKQTPPSYLAYNIVWFTNCSWLEQLTAFRQLDLYLDNGKSHL